MLSKGYCCVINGYRDPERHPFMSDSLISCLLHSGRGFTDDSTSPSIRQKSSESWTEFEGACPGFTCLMAYALLFPSYCADVWGFDSWSQFGCCFVFYKDGFFHDKDKSNMSLHWWSTLIDILWPEVLVQSFKTSPLPVFLCPLVISFLIVLLSDRPVDGKWHYYHSGFSGFLETKIKPTVVT